MAGERGTGVTFIRMNRHMDRGDILLKKRLKIDPEDNAVTLDGKLARLAADAIVPLLTKIAHGGLRPIKQDNKKASYAPKLKKEEGRLDWSLTSGEIVNRFRGCYGWPGTFTTFRGRRLNITGLSRIAGKSPGRPGEVIEALPERLAVACGKGGVLLQEVTPESQPTMSAFRFVSSFRVQNGEFFGAVSEKT
jgi:methionyl-tRNA formyltransferase